MLIGIFHFNTWLNAFLFLFKSSLNSIMRTPWMRACSFQRGVRSDWPLLELWGLCLCLQLSQVPQESAETGMCVHVHVHMWVCISACIREMSLVHEFLGVMVSPHTYIGCLRGLQLGRPSLLKALRSQRHQLSMTSPFPAHQYELIVALLKACKG